MASAPGTSAVERSVPSVTIFHPERQTIRRAISQPGYIQAFEQTPLFSKIPGYVQKLNADIGDRVSKGDVLALLWVPEMEVDVTQKQALVDQAGAEVKQAREGLLVAEADFQSAEARIQAVVASRLRAEAQAQRSQSQYDRFKKAGRQGTLGQEDVEEMRLGSETSKAALQEAEAQVRSAQAERDANRARREMARAGVGVAEARLAVAKANHEQSKTMLEYRRVTAPFDGVVTQRQVDTGHFVQPATGPHGEALFVVMRTDVMRIRVEVPEADADWVNPGAAARIRVQALKSYEVAGQVTRTSWSLNPTARTLLAEFDVSDAGGKLRPGMYAYATITAERPQVWTLPASAVVTEGDVTQGYQTYAYFLKDGKAWRTPLEVGARDPQRVEVLKRQTRPTSPSEPARWEAITGQEEVVSGNVSGLSDGQPVAVSAPGPAHGD
jgi:multidrug efflux pump subunit AcrA (membrane-fusion protein)